MVNTSSPSEVSLPPVMSNVHSLFKDALINRYDKALDRIQSHLRNEARFTDDTNAKEAYVIAIENSKMKRFDMKSCFEKLLDQAFSAHQKTFTQQRDESKPVSAVNLDLSHLTLVDEDSLQESIDIQTMVANTLRGCEYLLVPITSGIAKAYEVNKVDQHSHTLSPTRIGDWLQQSLLIGQFQGVARHAIYEIFREELFDTLAPLYKEVIDIFQAHSVELAMQQSKSHSLHIDTLMAHPDEIIFGSSNSLAVDKRKTKNAISKDNKPSQEVADTPLIDKVDLRPLKKGSIQETLSNETKLESAALNQNLKPKKTAKKRPAAPKFVGINAWIEKNQLPQIIHFPDEFVSKINDRYGLSDIKSDDDRTLISVSARQLDEVLASFQLQMLRDDTDWVEKLRQYLHSRTNSHELCVINPNHENIMRLINHAMNLICQAFHPAVARYLSSLRIAFVRLAISDNTFLSSSLHPAKSLFDALTYLSYGLNPNNKRIIKQLFRMVRSFYEAGAGEGPTFELLQHELLGFIEAEHQGTIDKEIESLNELYSQKQRYLAFKTADAFIDTRFESMSRLLSFHQLLHVVLRHVLAESYLNGGAGSEGWRRATQLFNALVWTSQAKSTEENVHRILSAMPELLSKLGAFFKKHGVPLDRHSLVIKQINEIQKLIVDGRDGTSINDDDLSQTTTVQYLLNKVKSETQERYRQKIKIGSDHDCARPFAKTNVKPTLKSGQWMAYFVEDSLCMCKYVFHFAPLDKFVFVNWGGEKLFERDANLVDMDILKGYAKVLSSPLPLESALRYVIKQAKSKT